MPEVIVQASAPSPTAKRLGYMVLGLVVGFLLSAFLPARPLHAVATQGQDGYALATGLVEDGVEGVFFLDNLTGELSGAVINLNTRKFTTFFKYNINADFKIEAGKPGKFFMVTGVAALRQGASGTPNVQPGQSIIYIMDVNSGVCAAYAIPWFRGRAVQPNNAPQNATFIPLDMVKFREIAVRPN